MELELDDVEMTAFSGLHIHETPEGKTFRNLGDTDIGLTGQYRVCKPDSGDCLVVLRPGDAWALTWHEPVYQGTDCDRFSDAEIDGWIKDFTTQDPGPEPEPPKKKLRYIDLKRKT